MSRPQPRGNPPPVPALVLTCLLPWLLVPAATIAAPAVRIAAADLAAGAAPAGITDNAAFWPGRGARPAREAFEGALALDEVPMLTVPADLKAHDVLGKDAQFFPAVTLAFITVGADLVPASEDVLRSGSTGAGRSYWDVLVQPGRVWSEPGDDGWSRAAFPFALVHSLEGETHNGIALFLYRHGRVSAVRFQIVQQTTPGNITTYFTASGVTGARYAPGRIADRDRVVREHRAAQRDAVAVRDWPELGRIAGADKLEGFGDGLEADEIVLAGLDYHGTFYLRGCTSAGGPMPWCERARFGIWSVTKAFANEVALLRLAQKYGPGVFALRIRDYVPEAAAETRWRNVRFDDCINMATGVGNGSTRRDPNDSGDGYIDATYWDWANTASRADKVATLLRIAPAYPWGPGEVVRYRDQDMFILGVAMDNFLKSREGQGASLWSMLEREVYAPIGLHHAPTNRTIEADGTAGQPLMAYGYYATLGDLVKVARLYHARGRHAGRQLLYAPRIDQLRAGPAPRGLPTGNRTRDGEMLYFNAFWQMRYDALEGCKLYVPQMLGWGGNIVALYPGGVTGIRVAKSTPERFAAQNETTAMATVANRLVPFCH